MYCKQCGQRLEKDALFCFHCGAEQELIEEPAAPVEPEKAHQMNPAAWLNNENVANYNEILRRVCADKRAVYVDVQSVMADDSGTLPAESTTDGIHFTRSWYEKWYGYLKTHTVS